MDLFVKKTQLQFETLNVEKEEEVKITKKLIKQVD